MHNIFKDNYNIYKQYHNNIYNIYFHKISIPLIILTSFILLNNFKIIKIPVNIILLFLYSSYYFYINLELALYANSFYLLLYIISIKLKKIKNIYKISIIIFSICWLTQITGHLLFEKNKPAFINNLKQSLLMAPLFIFV